jgi:hypothetical protein
LRQDAGKDGWVVNLDVPGSRAIDFDVGISEQISDGPLFL